MAFNRRADGACGAAGGPAARLGVVGDAGAPHAGNAARGSHRGRRRRRLAWRGRNVASHRPDERGEPAQARGGQKGRAARHRLRLPAHADRRRRRQAPARRNQARRPLGVPAHAGGRLQPAAHSRGRGEPRALAPDLRAGDGAADGPARRVSSAAELQRGLPSDGVVVPLIRHLAAHLLEPLLADQRVGAEAAE